MSELLSRKCVNCKPGTPALSAEQQSLYSKDIPGWKNVDGKKLSCEFKFPSYMAGVTWANKVAELADQEDHHPDIHIYYRKVLIETWTHTVNGLSENDYILAAKIDKLT